MKIYMKKISLFIFIFFCLYCDGFYQQIFLQSPKKVTLHLLEVDLEKVDLKLEHALGSRENVSHMVKRTGAWAGINAGFFRRGGMLNGNSITFLKIGDKIFSDPGVRRGSLLWSDNTDVKCARIATSWRFEVNGKEVSINKINQPGVENEIVLYNHSFGKYTMNECAGKEFVIVNNHITSCSDAGYSITPKNGHVLFIGAEVFKNIPFLADVSHGDQCLVRCSLYADGKLHKNWPRFMVNGAGTLIKNGEIQPETQILQELGDGREIVSSPDEVSANFKNFKEAEWLVKGSHPRTTIGLKNKKLLMVVVEGRLEGRSEGMTLTELAQFMFDRGYTDAINLGGGGDSTMVINNKIVNRPSGSSSASFSCGERPVSDALLIFKD